MMKNDAAYLRPSELCDFDIHPEIRVKAKELIQGCSSNEDAFQRIFTFVKELPYGLDDWDVSASEVLAKGWGMCSGKTNLLVAMLRSVDIPARCRIYRIKGEGSLWSWMSGDENMGQCLGEAPVQQDHVDCEVWIDEWKVCDPSRDTAMEQGLSAFGIPLEREPVLDESGEANYLILAYFDDWIRARQAGRRFRQNRVEIFTWVNEQLGKIRELGQGST